MRARKCLVALGAAMTATDASRDLTTALRVAVDVGRGRIAAPERRALSGTATCNGRWMPLEGIVQIRA